MDYRTWGKEYLEEAQRLKQRLVPVRQQLHRRGLGVEESRNLAWREKTLYEMYLECRATGKYLTEERL